MTHKQLQQIRDALRKCDSKPKYTDQAKDEALAILDAALAAPEPQPKYWMTKESEYRLKNGGNSKGAVPVHAKRSNTAVIPLYTAPVAAPQREWVGLTAEEFVACLVKSLCTGTVRLTREIGPYDITDSTEPADRLYRAIDAALRARGESA